MLNLLTAIAHYIRRNAFDLRDLDQTVKAYYLQADSELAAITIGGAVFLIPPMAYLDYFYYGLSNNFYGALLAELLFAAFSVGIVFLLRRNGQVKTYESLVFGWGLVTAIFALTTTVLQAPRVLENILFCLLFFIADFILLQNRLRFRIIPAAIIYLAFLTALLTNSTWFVFPNTYMFVLMLLVLTVVGMNVVASNNHYKLIAFSYQKGEQAAHHLYETLARTDSLTGIPNRRDFYEHAEQEWNAYRWHASTFCIAILDLDRLKQINDTCGHAVGDQVLKELSRLIATQMRSTDFYARLGGDEFAFILRGVNPDAAATAIARLAHAARMLKIPALGPGLPITISAGVAPVRPEDESLDDTIHRADQALYRAKEQGRDRIEQG
ncbi:MAG: GGDEF domain-containing protein [Anaerolineae bacterium]